MRIRYVTIEGGILDGFQQEFDPQLNVLIGGRGTGKSSIIELIRFCLGASSYTPAAEKEAVEHALGVLGDGRITILLETDESLFEVSRTALDASPTQAIPFPSPFVFSQSEIESVGLQASSRLRLIDSFLEASLQAHADDGLAARIRSATAEIRSLLVEIDDIDEKTADLPKRRAQLDELAHQRTSRSSVHAEIDGFRKTLAELAPSVASAHVRADVLSRSARRLGSWVEAIESILDQKPDLEPWPDQIGTEDELSELRKRERHAYARMLTGLEEVQAVAAELRQRKTLAESQHAGVENRAREVRLRMEEREKGTSALEKQVGDLVQQIAVLTSLRDLKRTRQERVASLVGQRAKLIASREAQRQALTKSRQQVAAQLNRQIGPNIRVTVMPFAQRREYVSALAGALRGSGLRYNDLAERIAETFSPTEIATLAEQRDVTKIAEALDISEERATRLSDALRSSDGESLFAVAVEDDILIELMDGSDFKTIDFLSMGQRCTAILPIILAHDRRLVILDQPEDHLDNAFVVNTLVKAIAGRRHAQSVVATHNPNIPVIGNARKVFQLDSDGARCFVRNKGPLSSPAIVQAISTIMEGGREAFRRRANFYDGAE